MNCKRVLLVVMMSMWAFVSYIKAQSKNEKTKLMVTIVVDQMRDEYLYRFYDQYGENGFKKLLNEGLVCRNVQYNYVPTFTGPGHSTIYTGTTPRYHGVIGNSWYDRHKKRSIYCVEDSMVNGVGSTSINGLRSPHLLMASTLADELEIFTQKRALSYSISLKDRAAILPGGHCCDGAFWYDNASGRFITSTYYTNELPHWLIEFNAKKRADDYMKKEWDLLLSKDQYDDSAEDENPYEFPDHVLEGVDKAVFPYDLKKIGKKHNPYDLLIHTPWGNTIVADMVLETINHIDFGKDDITDLLMISFSSTDAIGHLWGPQSKEIEDTYVRLDKDLARIIAALDEKVGKGAYTLMLTADHAVGEVIEDMQDRNIPAGSFKMEEAAALVDSLFDEKYGAEDWIEYHRNHIIYLEKHLFIKHDVDLEKATSYATYLLNDMEGVFQAFSSFQLMENEYQLRGARHIQMGFNPKRSGEIILTFEPGWATGHPKAAADHGTQYCYDTHVPLIFYGQSIQAGEDFKAYDITDVAPTISLLLKIKFPNATIGQPIESLWKK